MSMQAQAEAGRAQDCVYLSNLPYDATAGTIKEIFDQKKIPVSSVQLIKKGSFNRQRNSGLACVVLSKSSDVDNSCKTLDGKNVMGRPMIVRKNKFEDDQPSYHVPAAAAAMQPAAV